MIRLKCKYLLFYLFLLSNAVLKSQDTITVDEAILIALENNPLIKNSLYEIEKSKAAVIEIPSTEFSYQYGQINSPENDYYFNVNQNFGPVLSHFNSVKQNKKQVELSNAEYEIKKKELIIKVKSMFYQLIHLYKQIELIAEEKSHYENLTNAAEFKFETGDINMLDKIKYSTRQAEIEMKYNTLSDEVYIAENNLKFLLGTNEEIVPSFEDYELYMIEKLNPETEYNGEILINAGQKNAELQYVRVKYEKSVFFPEISAGYFIQDIDTYKGLDGWHLGISVPLTFFSQSAKIKMAKIDKEIALNNLENTKMEINHKVDNLVSELNKYFKQVVFYKEFKLKLADEIMYNYKAQLEKEEIDYFEFIEGISESYKIKNEFIDVINNYNQVAIHLEFFAN